MNIRITRIVPFKDLHQLDREEFPLLAERPSMVFYGYGDNEDEALDEFHESVPIKVLDDFTIEVE